MGTTVTCWLLTVALTTGKPGGSDGPERAVTAGIHNEGQTTQVLSRPLFPRFEVTSLVAVARGREPR